MVDEAPRGFGAETDRCDVIFLFAPLTVKRAVAAMETKEGVDRAVGGHRRRLLLPADREGHEQPHGQGRSRKPEYQNMTIRSWGTTTKLLALMEQTG